VTAIVGARPAVLVLGPPRYVGPLGVMRSLGRMGVKVYALRHSVRSAANSSRYCAGTVPAGDDGRPASNDAVMLAELDAAGRVLGEGTILIAGSDEWAVFVARYSDELKRRFSFPATSLQLIEELAAKDGLYRLATKHGLPTPKIVFPTDANDAAAVAGSLAYPVMLKPIHSRPDVLTKAVATNPEQLMAAYRQMEETPQAPNVMFQEFIPGNDQDVWIFNGYFDAGSNCLAAFTGVKVRQHPAKMGIASLGELRQNPAVIEATCNFLKTVGYQGIVDIGYRYDRRDGRYYVLDINPRLGGAFRIFVDETGMDVARAMYLDLTGQVVPPVVARDGRRWVKEDADLIAASHYRRLDGLGFFDWLRSYRGVREGAAWALDDPIPFLVSMAAMARETLSAKWKRWRRRPRAAVRAGWRAATGSKESAA
jgi:D-aspartate ligase